MLGRIVAAAAVLASAVSAQVVTYPGFGQTATYTVGQQLTVTWTSPYQYTFLWLYQGQGNDWIYSQLANVTSSTTSYTWTAQSLDGGNLNGEFFFFRVGNGLDPNVAYGDSGQITVLASTNGVTGASSVSAPSATGTSSGASSATSATAATTASSSAAASSTAASTSAAAPAATSASTTPATGSTGSTGSTDHGTTSADSTEPHYNWLPSYLGVGLGVGIPVLLAVIAGIWYSIHSRRKLARESVALEKGRGAP